MDPRGVWAPSVVTSAAIAAALVLGSGVVISQANVLSAVSGGSNDLTLAAGAVTVTSLRGATVPSGSGLTTGNVLQATGSGALGYAALNLAGGAGFVTGALPSANQASQTMAGDVTGTTAASVLSAITGTSSLVTVVSTTALQWGASAASIGNNRYPNATTGSAARNAANSGDITLFATDSSNNVYIGQTSGTTAQANIVDLGATSAINLRISGAIAFQLTATQLSAAQAGSTYSVIQAARTSDAVTHNFTIQSQQPFASATGANRVPGNLVFDVGTPTNSGTTFAAHQFKNNGAVAWTMGQDSTSAFLSGPGTVSATGQTRFANAITMMAVRNAANSGDLNVLAVNASNTLSIGSSSGVTAVLGSSILLEAGVTLYGLTNFLSTVSSPTFIHTAAASDVATTALAVRAQDAFASAVTNVNGGKLRLQGGKALTEGTTGLRGGIALELSSTGIVMAQVAEVVVGNRIVALNRAANISATEMPANTGDLVTFIGNAATNPNANPVSGGTLYANGGAGTWRGSGGTTTVFAS